MAFLHVLIHSGDNVLLEGHKKILVKPQKNVILIETDKGLYKPGETGKARRQHTEMGREGSRKQPHLEGRFHQVQQAKSVGDGRK